MPKAFNPSFEEGWAGLHQQRHHLVRGVHEGEHMLVGVGELLSGGGGEDDAPSLMLLLSLFDGQDLIGSWVDLLTGK